MGPGCGDSLHSFVWARERKAGQYPFGAIHMSTIPHWQHYLLPISEWAASDGYRPGSACWDHPAVLGLIERFVDRVVTRYRDRKWVMGWDRGVARPARIQAGKESRFEAAAGKTLIDMLQGTTPAGVRRQIVDGRILSPYSEGVLIEQDGGALPWTITNHG